MRNYEEMTVFEFHAKVNAVCGKSGNCDDCLLCGMDCADDMYATPKDDLLKSMQNYDEAYKELFGDKDWREL